MKIVILNGSPKGDISVTMQDVAYLKKKFPEHIFETVNVAHEIKKIEKDPAYFAAILDRIRPGDLCTLGVPALLYAGLCPVQAVHRAVFEHNAQEAFSGKDAAALTTSIHYFDQTAHAYIRAVSDDLGTQDPGRLLCGNAGSLGGEGAHPARRSLPRSSLPL